MKTSLSNHGWIKLVFYCFLNAVIFIPSGVFAMSVSVNISDTNLVAHAGDRLYFTGDIKYPENRARQDLRIKYEIIQHNIVLAEASVLKAVETQVQFFDYIVVPVSIQSGKAELRMSISDYDSLHNAVSVSFDVVEGSDQVKLYLFIIIMFVFCTSIASAIAVYVAKRLHHT